METASHAKKKKSHNKPNLTPPLWKEVQLPKPWLEGGESLSALAYDSQAVTITSYLSCQIFRMEDSRVVFKNLQVLSIQMFFHYFIFFSASDLFLDFFNGCQPTLTMLSCFTRIQKVTSTFSKSLPWMDRCFLLKALTVLRNFATKTKSKIFIPWLTSCNAQESIALSFPSSGREAANKDS